MSNPRKYMLMLGVPKKVLGIIFLLLTLTSVYFRVSGQNHISVPRNLVTRLLSPLSIYTNESGRNSKSSILSTTSDSTIINDTIWRVMLHPECDCPMAAITEAYDGGYLMLGWFGSSFPTKCWLIKTDVNGNKLWERVFSGGNFAKVTVGICENKQGDIFITGGTY